MHAAFHVIGLLVLAQVASSAVVRRGAVQVVPVVTLAKMTTVWLYASYVSDALPFGEYVPIVHRRGHHIQDSKQYPQENVPSPTVGNDGNDIGTDINESPTVDTGILPVQDSGSVSDENLDVPAFNTDLDAEQFASMDMTLALPETGTQETAFASSDAAEVGVEITPTVLEGGISRPTAELEVSEPTAAGEITAAEEEPLPQTTEDASEAFSFPEQDIGTADIPVESGVANVISDGAEISGFDSGSTTASEHPSPTPAVPYGGYATAIGSYKPTTSIKADWEYEKANPTKAVDEDGY